MTTRKIFIPNPLRPSWNAHSHHVREMLGLPKKLPVTGLPAQTIHGIRVWLEPAAPKQVVDRWGKQHIVKSSTHRVKAECPHCQLILSAGRLHQHKCAKAPVVDIRSATAPLPKLPTVTLQCKVCSHVQQVKAAARDDDGALYFGSRYDFCDKCDGYVVALPPIPTNS